ncbi:glycerol dehydrogenase [Erwinia toletana]|uniref:Glycerol dehydrogenase n=1 Tax=Winslowiella toletana TaxID=92490 RepID=A0ABS4P6N8_9GAMM|nr:iron-containing alcohol dehydrogenase family protein [Winslowiella toletana]MBP2168318.1 glycerol dehydrogenase [Winslowiella toletana]
MIAIKTPGNYLNQSGGINQIGDYIAPLAQRIALITSPTAWEVTRQAVETSLQRHAIHYQVWFLTGPCCLETLQQFAIEIDKQGAELIAGVGGGRVMDAAKGIGGLLGNLAVINVPTIAATCAAWSPITVLYDQQGGHHNSVVQQRPPVWVLVDTAIIAQSPVRYLRAGIVDAIAKWYEFSLYQHHSDAGLGLQLKIQAAKSALEVINHYGGQAVADNTQHIVSGALSQVIDANIALAGLANSIFDDVPRAGMAHLIHDVLTRYPQCHGWLHGEMVGFSLNVQSQLEEIEDERQQGLRKLLRRYHAPATLQQFGLAQQSSLLTTLAEAIVVATDIPAQLPFTVTREQVLAAFIATDSIDTAV